ncbi:Low-affinity potassium transport protein [Sparassis crispa]|uniref:Potassium transport protein n=1 Tax=Sparassis crispa TaxID=139825 RepID=A0A401GF53_9APHY|nr:Low-affinity potassium transport protein [Sparassis crispa]GBE80755.1 Low-affinity potassium transport protein [Sparassis crispa]
MAPSPSTHHSQSRTRAIRSFLVHHLNFYRVHILFFLFNSVSAMTVCGISTVDLSGLTAFQQVLLFIQMCLGSPVAVSWVMVYTRRSFFARKFRHMIGVDLARGIAAEVHAPVQVTLVPWWRRALNMLHPGGRRSYGPDFKGSDSLDRCSSPHVRPDMIRRMDDAPRLINPTGSISEGRTRPFAGADKPRSSHETADHFRADSPHGPPSSDVHSSRPVADDSRATRRGDGTLAWRMITNPAALSESVVSDVHSLHTISPISTTFATPPPSGMPHTHAVEFSSVPRPSRDAHAAGGNLPDHTPFSVGPDHIEILSHDGRSMRRPSSSLLRSTDAPPPYPSSRRALHRDFGGFPMPNVIFSRLLKRFFPKFERKLTRTMTIPRTRTIASQHGTVLAGVNAVPYITFEAVVGRNSAFKNLTREQMDELGGVEYRGLTALLWLVAGYHILLQLLAFVVIAPYMSIPRWSSDFRPPMLHREVSPVWFSLFQVVSSYTNTGMSLEDTSMVPFQTAYPMIVLMIILILAGNTAFPVFLRLMIWTITKVIPKHSRLNVTLHFLLDHPRRCFIYLFPSHQTWFLLTVLLVLNCTDWFFFLVLDIGNSAIKSIPVGVRVIIGLLQATAVRASGFGTVPLSVLAPAVKVLYVIMMYISVYPIAMSVRSTNVYEERSLGVFKEDDSIDETFNPSGNRVTVWGRYLASHMRKQLSFDMWWLALALFLVCIVERDNLINTNNLEWFTIFSILFELVSAYGTVGLSLGVPYANYSFSGAFRPLSKLILCAVMLRGRHRGLPVAIDRAVMLPSEFQESLDQDSPIRSHDTPNDSRDTFDRPEPQTDNLYLHETNSTRQRPHPFSRRHSDSSIHEMRLWNG